MAPKDSFLTLSIRNLPMGTTAQDVCDHINRSYSNAQPTVGPIVKEPNRPRLYTTVTIRQDDSDKCKSLRNGLNAKPFIPRHPTTNVKETEIKVNDEFLGVTTVAEHDNPQFDLYFIHGLGGHASKSWSTDKGFPYMWPKDFLPDDVKERPLDPNNPDGPKLAGRFSVIGYRADWRKTWSATTSIEKNAENLLSAIKTDRPEGCARPMYFACHSLGGLIACQALIHALRSDANESERFQEPYQNVFYHNDQFLVKGMFFFGTPFDGSNLANHASTIIRFLKGNQVLIENLKEKSSDLTNIVAKFNQIRSDEKTGISIMICYEKQPMYGYKFVTTPGSAMSSFRVQTLGIEGDHRTMIKFPDNHDESYRTISDLMIRIIQSTLSGSSSISSPSTGSFPWSPFTPSLPTRTQTNRSTNSPPPYPGGPAASYQNITIHGQSSDSRSLLVGLGSSASSSPSHPSGHQGPSIPTKTKANTGDPWRNNPFAPVKMEDLMQQTTLDGRNQLAVAREDNHELALLSQFDTVFLLDDTGSMSESDMPNPSSPSTGHPSDSPPSRWDELVQSLRYIVEIVCRYDRDGVDVHFFCNDSKDELGITDGQRILDLLTNEVGPDEEGGGTFIGQQIWVILSTYLERFEEYKKHLSDRGRGGNNNRQRQQQQPRPDKPKKLNLIVITDGAADDKESVEDVIVQAAKRLDALHASSDQVGIQFLQIGKDVNAARWLRLLDDSLKERYGIRDIVDTRPWDSPNEINKSFRDRLAQILLGGILRSKDGEATTDRFSPDLN
ncbi:hypothetical protein B0T17DRAFT_152656 [Bombardia bombarda]|uniref:VWFA domain-containing protein n=1 Tax=Bombardia bombarda TaxID=252184 RepID=A0AA39X6W5_9PEZI|nr:hypothetical protein B0T17DRAFT_152656 [Bombardia bombarda]